MSPDEARQRYPAASRWLGVESVRALASTTYLVGMICPGLHSIYSELSVRFGSKGAPAGMLAHRVVQTDPRFERVEQAIAGGGLTGLVKSFVRSPPVEQASMSSLAGAVAAEEFSGSTALIVGGSRGLGELTAKLIATGGGHSVITWHRGQDDAERVAAQIRAAGGRCDVLRYDALGPAAEQLAALTRTPTHAYYFATPAIFRPGANVFARERFDELTAVYVHGFWQLFQALRARQPALSMFYPSSIAVAERPKDITEYSMAKAAGEVLCADMNKSLAAVHVTVRRLPRILTDQTTSVSATESASAFDTMLPIVREVQSWPR